MDSKTDLKWLEAWKDNIKGKKVLELGAGDGLDSTYLRKYAGSLISTDIAASKDLQVTFLDHSKALPFDDETFDVIVMSLSLHYFTWSNTVSIVQELNRALSTNGLLICRVNSVNDTHYGATGYPEIEPRLYKVKNKLKRFFTKEDILTLFAHGWIINNLADKNIDRYKKIKSIWEFGALKS